MTKLEGTWKLTINSMMGEETSTCTYHVNGDVLTGEVVDGNSGERSPIENGTASGNAFHYNVTMKLPFGIMPFEMSGTILEDGTLEGESVMPMGTSRFTGVKIEQE